MVGGGLVGALLLGEKVEGARGVGEDEESGCESRDGGVRRETICGHNGLNLPVVICDIIEVSCRPGGRILGP